MDATTAEEVPLPHAKAPEVPGGGAPTTTSEATARMRIAPLRRNMMEATYTLAGFQSSTMRLYGTPATGEFDGIARTLESLGYAPQIGLELDLRWTRESLAGDRGRPTLPWCLTSWLPPPALNASEEALNKGRT